MNENDHLRLRMEKRRHAKPKSLTDLFIGLNKVQFNKPTKPNVELVTMKAQCKRLAGRTLMVGSTAFQFDPNGICTHKPRFRANELRDFEKLCTMTGVVLLDDAPAPSDDNFELPIDVQALADAVTEEQPMILTEAEDVPAPTEELSNAEEWPEVLEPVVNAPAPEPVSSPQVVEQEISQPENPVILSIAPDLGVKSEKSEEGDVGGKPTKTRRRRK